MTEAEQAPPVYGPPTATAAENREQAELDRAAAFAESVAEGAGGALGAMVMIAVVGAFVAIIQKGKGNGKGNGKR